MTGKVLYKRKYFMDDVYWSQGQDPGSTYFSGYQ
jgi:hypothetical protein